MDPAFLYGESVFTSFTLLEGKIPFREAHINRLLDGVQQYYGLHDDDGELRERLEQKLGEYIFNRSNGYVRVIVHAPEREGLIPNLHSASELEILVIVKEKENALRLLKVKTFESPFTSYYPKIKMGSYMPHLYFKKRAKAAGWDDALFLQEGKVTELSTSSLFFVKNGQVFTSKSIDVFPGIMRQWCLQNLNAIEQDIFLRDVAEFDYAFAVNAVSHFLVVRQIDDLIYQKTDVTLIENMLKKIKEQLL